MRSESRPACVQEATTVEHLLAFFLENGRRAAPVLRADSTLAGYVSLADLSLDHGGRSGVELGPGLHLPSAGRTVGDVMSFPLLHVLRWLALQDARMPRVTFCLA
jgi:CBS domain-containing protein